ncbi:MAG: PH domain-containing protein [bacterium JZ-2024 1]
MKTNDRPTGKTDEVPILEVRPSAWCFFWHWVFFFLVVPLLIAWIRRASLTLSVYEDRVALRTGFLSRDVREIYVTDIQTLEIKQTFFQRLVNVGTVMISSAGEGGYEIVAPCVPHPFQIKDVLTRQRRTSRSARE